ncbi:MAG: hypothetical protein KatS3mg125_1378 [Lysobacterales bacterium]|nr:MAG: hypothetical protein KatS3mg125_1378 [Xanthomonadales bacterium]
MGGLGFGIRRQGRGKENGQGPVRLSAVGSAFAGLLRLVHGILKR